MDHESEEFTLRVDSLDTTKGVFPLGEIQDRIFYITDADFCLDNAPSVLGGCFENGGKPIFIFEEFLRRFLRRFTAATAPSRTRR